MHYDVIIVGTGLAGLYTALNCPSTWKIALLCKEKLDSCNSDLAQGGIAATMEEEDEAQHVADTLKAGLYYNDEDAVRLIVREGKKHIHQLMNWGARFDRDEKGALSPTREGGHNARRVLHFKDATGHEVMRALTEHLKGQAHITCYEETALIDVLTDQGKAVGIRALDLNTQDFIDLFSHQVVLATGGIGQLYQHTTNSRISSGDGIACALRCGARLKDMEMVQFHPSAFYEAGVVRHFLVSEAVRGEGGILRNIHGEPFMENVHPLKDLAPRDIVAREIYKQLQKTQSPFVYIDVRHLEGDYIKKRFPMIYETCLKAGFDMLKDLIPVCTVEHYHMGGIETDLWGQTSVKGLYAVGEVACTGAHGANRLASNSLLEALVLAARAAEHMKGTYVVKSEGMSDLGPLRQNLGHEHGTVPKIITEDEAALLLDDVRRILTQYGFIFRTHRGLKEGCAALDALSAQYANFEPKSEAGIVALNGLLVAKEILAAASNRKESLGAHQLLQEDELC